MSFPKVIFQDSDYVELAHNVDPSATSFDPTPYILTGTTPIVLCKNVNVRDNGNPATVNTYLWDSTNWH